LWAAIAMDTSQMPLVGIGVTFKRDKRSGAYVVKRIVDGGSAARAQTILPGDGFDEVNAPPGSPGGPGSPWAPPD
jgi:C-terminal processing protease CtpA/Prc